MKSKCPKCSSSELSTDNPYGLMICSNCRWTSSRSTTEAKMWMDSRTALRWLSIVVLSVLFVGLSAQIFFWRRYALDVSWIRLKQVVGMERMRDRMELGAICNSLGKHDCSVEVFLNIVEEDPENKIALANLAVNYAKKKDWNKALPHFEAYFSLGGYGYDVMYWYAMNLMQKNKEQEGIKWLYFSLSANNKFKKASQTIFNKLIEMNRPYEALSLVAALTSGRPEQWPEWNQRIFQLDLNEKKGARESVRLSSLKDDHFYVPVWLNNKNRLRYFVVEPDLSEVILNEDILFENQIKIPDEAVENEVLTLVGRQKLKKMKVPYLRVGPWSFNDVEIYVCSQCRSALGKRFLKKFRTEIWRQQDVRFLNLAMD